MSSTTTWSCEGLDIEDEEAKWSQAVQRMQGGYSLPDEEPARNDEPPLPNGLRQVPINPSQLQVWQQQQQQKQQEELAGRPPDQDSPDRLNWLRAPPEGNSGQEAEEVAGGGASFFANHAILSLAPHAGRGWPQAG